MGHSQLGVRCQSHENWWSSWEKERAGAPWMEEGWSFGPPTAAAALIKLKTWNPGALLGCFQPAVAINPQTSNFIQSYCRYEPIKHWRGSEPSRRRSGAQNVTAGTVWSSDAIFAEEMILFYCTIVVFFLWTPPAKQRRRDRINFRTKNCKGDEKFDDIRVV